MKTIQELETFLATDFLAWLDVLTENHTALWGRMDSQQMVEHLTIAINVSNGKQLVELDTPLEKIDKIKNITLLSDRSMQREFKNVALPNDPMPYVNEDLPAAKLALKSSVLLFKQYFKNSADKKQLHNIFGALTYHEWLWFHYKHLIHHFSQFGVIPTVERIN
jgi:hypothetical protein